MANQLPQSIQDLRALAPKLNQATDDTARAVTQVERLLNEECSVGLPCEVCVDQDHLLIDRSDSSEKVTDWTMLCYDRIDGKFRIAVRVKRESEGVSSAGRAFLPPSAYLLGRPRAKTCCSRLSPSLTSFCRITGTTLGSGGVIGLEPSEDSSELRRIYGDRLQRRFTYAGTAGDRNKHMMTGRIV